MTEQSSSGKENRVTLKEFVESNHKLLSVIGIFTAITVFSTNIKSFYFSVGLSFLSLSLNILLWLELIHQFPKDGSSLLSWFEIVLSFLMLSFIGFWIVEYYIVWNLFIEQVIAFILLGVVSSIIKKYNLFNRLFKTKNEKKNGLRYLIFFILIFSTYIIGFFLGNYLSPYIQDILLQLYNTSH